MLVDEVVQDRFSADLPGAGAGCGDAGTGISARDTLADAQMRAGAVVMLSVLGQNYSQVRLAHDQGPVRLVLRDAEEPIDDAVGLWAPHSGSDVPEQRVVAGGLIYPRHAGTLTSGITIDTIRVWAR
jgi:hypothetical protein